jgi:FlaA1/EpsC-like NDP-sugar epimerase
LNLTLVGFIDDDEENQGIQIDGYPILGSLDSLESILQEHAIAEVIVSRNDIPMPRLSQLAALCRSHRISLRRFQTQLEEVFLPA